MGFRLRKSVRFGPLRLNFSRSGIGYSVGGKGFRLTKKARGGLRTTVSLPGTGLSYVKESGGRRSKGGGRRAGAGALPVCGKSVQTPAPRRPKRAFPWGWALFAFFTFSMLAFFPSWASLFLLAAAALTFPRGPLARLFGGGRAYRAAQVAAVCALTILSSYTVPSRTSSLAVTEAPQSSAALFAASDPAPAAAPDVEQDAAAVSNPDVPGSAVSAVSGSAGPSDATAEEAQEKEQGEDSSAQTGESAQAAADSASPNAASGAAERSAAEQPPAAGTAGAGVPRTQAAAPPVQQPAQVPAAPQTQPSAAEPQGAMVWIAGSGEGTKYHSRSGCSNMKNPVQISLADAQRMGYTPCKRCY